jgi:magnesium and cobalt transporter
MVPRVQVRALDVDTPPAQVLPEAAAIAHSRIPVFRGSLEQPLGIVIIKDLLRVAAEGRRPPLSALLRPALFVPEGARISALLKEFQRTHQNLALVVDEYGGVVGLVTVEDVIEEIVGDIREEHEPVAPPAITRLEDGSFVIEGSAPVADVRRHLGAPIDEGDFNTLAGFVITALDAIPRTGDSFVAHGFRWTVVAMDGPRVARVRAEPPPPEPGGA